MKKNLFVIIGTFFIIITILFYTYYSYQKMQLIANQKNKQYENYTQSEILGSSLMSLIHKAIDENEKNEIAKDEQNRYIENEENSIRIEVKFLEADTTFPMEAIYTLGAEEFIKNYNHMTFICTKKEYHKKTNQIKYLLFEQI